MHENMLAFSCIRPVVFMRTPGRFPDVNCPNPPRITFCQYVLSVFRDFFIHLPHYKPIYKQITMKSLSTCYGWLFMAVILVLSVSCKSNTSDSKTDHSNYNETTQ